MAVKAYLSHLVHGTLTISSVLDKESKEKSLGVEGYEACRQ